MTNDHSCLLETYNNNQIPTYATADVIMTLSDT